MMMCVVVAVFRVEYQEAEGDPIKENKQLMELKDAPM